ncbi:splicing factor-like protein [Dunaliella salina]|uniref:Splicing factor-like protein n=1 Tax=Dunaliella salina TaxID=3046 RepID=A0ABQ7H8C6_DUNSA|nr:splicing factor-like protein [Dunaliella salina]|eukprot:KAF5843109.1 splicing factor-like protein [Dunaliella salina]
MPKHEAGSPKAIANAIKAKGLQKLRWYCQLCQKQCRDENGFKCHQMSESHMRQMELFGQSADKVVDGYSKEFEQAFLDHLKRAHPFSRVLAKNVYNEYINDRHHIHMNATRWLTLTEFVKYLGREGKCKVDETEKGWWITLIQRDPMEEIDEERRLKRTGAEREENCIERARKVARREEVEAPAGTELRKDEGEPLKLSLAPSTAGPSGGAAAAGPSAQRASSGVTASTSGQAPRSRPAAPASSIFGDDEGTDAAAAGGNKTLSKLDAIMKQELDAKAKSTRLDHWLFPNIIVKVMSKELKEAGVDQAQLETVLPQPGGRVLVVNGLYRGCTATLQAIDTDKFQAQVRLLDGPSRGKDVWQEYEDVCKLATT